MSNNDFFENVVRPKLDKCTTAGDMLRVLSENYELDARLGVITSLAFKQGLRAAVTMVDPKPKTL